MALKVLVEEGMIQNAARVGERLKRNLSGIRSRMVREVRGRGLMLAVELDPSAGGARPVCEALAVRGLLAKETHDHIVRISPPLILSADQADWIAEQFAAVLE
jgi:ornithine--oxo-acid transaminase